jgi:hypothetical protein
LDNMSDYSYFTESEEFGAGKGLDLISEWLKVSWKVGKKYKGATYCVEHYL